MTTVLYLTSLEPAGKTALAATIGRNLLSQGKKVAYFRPVELSEKSNHKRDAALLKEVLELSDSVNDISPFSLSSVELWHNLSVDSSDFLKKIKQKYNQIAAEKNAVIVEGPSGLSIDGAVTLACYSISELLNASVVVMLRYSDSLKPEILHKVKDELGERLIGVVINFVPANKLQMIKVEISRLFAEHGIEVLAIIPEERALWGVTVAELARGLHGEIVTAMDNTGKLVENVMLGAMSPDSGIEYFARRENKAAVIRSERSDLQLAALETSTACLVLTGKIKPIQAVTYNAESKKIPIILVDGKTNEVLGSIGKILSGSLFDNQQKFKKFQLICKEPDLKPLYLATGLAVQQN